MITTTHTNRSILDRFGVPDLALEYPELEVPVLTGAQRQGDVLVIPVTTSHGGDPIGPKGVVVVRAETDASNTHSLYSLVGESRWESNDRASVNDLVEGWLTVPDGGEATLLHQEEHNALGIGPGTYEIRRQREWAGEWAYVAD